MIHAGSRGLSGEIYDLRQDVDAAFSYLESTLVGLVPANDPTGATNRAQLQALINSGTSFRCSGVWYIDIPLVFGPSSKGIVADFGEAEIRWGTAHIAGDADTRTNAMIRVLGETIGAVNTTLAATEPHGSPSILVSSSSGIAPNGWLKVNGTNNVVGLGGRTDTVQVSEIIQVSSAYVSGASVLLEGVTLSQHDLGQTVVSWNPVENVTILGGYLNGIDSTTAVGIEITSSVNVSIHETRFRGFSRAPIDVYGAKNVFLEELVNEGDCNGFVWAGTSHDVQIDSPIAAGLYGRQHSTGNTRHQFWFYSHCTNVACNDINLRKVAGVLACWGGINCGGSGWRVDDVDCTEIVNRAVASERQSGMVGIIYEGGPGPINDLTCFGFGSFMRDGVFTNIHQPTLNGQKWAYAHDQFQVSFDGLTVINKGQSALDAGGYLGGMLISDFTGVITNINVSGTYRAVETNNFLGDVVFDNCRFDAFASVGTFSTQYGFHFDHHAQASSMKIGTVELVAFQGTHQFGSSFDSDPDRTWVWDVLRFEGETFKNIIPIRTNSAVVRGTVGHMQDPTATGYDAILEATGPNAKQLIFLGASANSWTLAALGDAVALHTGTAAKRGDLLVADALGNLIVNNNPPNDSAIYLARQASAGGRVQVVRIGSAPAFGILTAATSVRAPLFTSVSGDTVIRAPANQKVSVYEDVDKVFDAYYSAADSARRIDFPDTVLVNSANILVLRVAGSGRLQSPSLRNQFFWDDTGPTVGHDNTQKIILNVSTATTVGAPGGANALPATPTGYIRITVNGVAGKIPFYAE